MTIRFSKDQDTLHIPASLVKLMTVAVARQYITDGMLDTYVTVTADDSPLSGSGVALGDVVKYRDLFYCMMMNSSDAATHCIARNVGAIINPGAADHHAVFVTRMNQHAAAMGLTGAVFVDSWGYSSSNQMSARHVSTLMKGLSTDPLVMLAGGAMNHVVTTQAGRTFTVVNLLDVTGATVPDPRVVSGFPFPEHVANKYGILPASGYSLAIVWQHPRSGRRVTVVMGASDDTELKRDIRTLINYECLRN